MTSPISNLARSIAALRATLADPRRGTVAGARPPVAPPVPKIKRSAAGTPRRHLAMLGAKVATLALDPRTRRQKTLEAFVEAVLLDELGDELQNDVSFPALVARVVDGLQAQADSRALVDEALAELLGPETSK